MHFTREKTTSPDLLYLKIPAEIPRCRRLRRSLQIKPLWIITHSRRLCISNAAVSEGVGCIVLRSANAELHRIACWVEEPNVLWQAAGRRPSLPPVCGAADARLPEVAVTSSRTHYEDQVSMLSKCHSVAGEFIKISLFHQMPQKSIFQTGVKCYVHAILYFFTSLEWRMSAALCKYQDV